MVINNLISEDLLNYNEEVFDLLGINKKRLLHIKKPIRCKKIIIPSSTMSFGAECNYKYKKIIDRLISAANDIGIREKWPTHKKIYFNKRRHHTL